MFILRSLVVLLAVAAIAVAVLVANSLADRFATTAKAMAGASSAPVAVVAAPSQPAPAPVQDPVAELRRQLGM